MKMKKFFIGMATLALVLQACASPATQPPPTDPPTAAAEPTVSETEVPAEDTASRLERAGGYPCPDSDFTCIDVTVPLNHFDPQDARTTTVVFAVLPATGERKGMFVTVIGGPGGSGLMSADGYTSYFDPRITESFDVVFFDQRGINMSGGLYCIDAAAKYYRTDTDAATPEDEAQLLDVTKTFVDECVAEMGESELIPHLDTAQAVEDLEVFRALMGAEKFWLYGESYGTQFSQMYAVAHPDHLAGLILDGTVDITLTDTEFLKGQAAAFDDVLVATLEACDADEYCAADMGRDAIEVYDELAAQLKQTPAVFDFPLSAGGVESREFSFAELEATSGFLYSETARMMFLRALAAYSRDHTLVPLARVAYNSLSVNPDTLEAMLDPSWSDAIYYGVTCRDYAEQGATFDEQAELFLREGDEVDASLPRFSSVFYGDLPCVYWPYPKDDSLPAMLAEPFQGGDFPTLVLNATTDPATPYEGARSVFENLADGYMVTEIGGPHVIFGWGNECVDGLVAEFLVNDTLPAERETECEGYVADEFAPLALADASGYADPLEAFYAVDNEINYLPEYYYMSSTTARAIACPYGGTFAFDSDDTGDVYTLTDCAFSEGFVMTGSGSYNYDDGVFTLEVNVTGIKDGSLTYVRDADWAIHVTGEYGGEAIDLSE
jgi:pimeloyl-ACP methyl ester carboxylesterase